MKILFNNIGNRHLRYTFAGIDKQGNPVEKNLYNEKFEFKTVTLQLLENFEQEKYKIQIEILKKYLGEKNKIDYPDRIILFGTDQEKTAQEQKHTNQDTYWTALIVKNIIEEKYKIPVEVIKIERNPSDENDLIPVYQSLFKQIKNNYSQSEWVFLDAGGTPQQKLVCKLLMPEIHSNTKIEYISNVEGVDKNDLREKNTEELEKIFIKKNVKELIKNYHYASAYQLLCKVEQKNPALPFIKLGKLRKQNVWKDIAGEFDKPNRKNKMLVDFIDKIPPINLQDLEENLDKLDYYVYGEFLARAALYLENNDNNNFILQFQQSLEHLLIAFIHKYAQETGNTIKKDFDGVGEFLKAEFQIETNAVSTQLEAVIKITEEENLHTVKQLLELYATINNSYHRHIKQKGVENKNSIQGLDRLRNKIAHSSKYIEKIPKNILDAFNKITQLTRLDKCTYANLNGKITDLLY